MWRIAGFVSQIAETVWISKGSVESIFHQDLHMNKIAAKWVHQMLNHLDKQHLLATSIDTLALMEGEEDFLRSVLTGDESWIHHYEPESKQESLVWKTPAEPRPVKFKASKSTGKVLLSIFWDSKGVVQTDYLEHGGTINGQYYAGLMHRLRAAILQKRRGQIRRGVLLLHDNAPAHEPCCTGSYPRLASTSFPIRHTLQIFLRVITSLYQPQEIASGPAFRDRQRGEGSG